MQVVQRFLLAGFALFAAITVVLQMRYGSLCGHSGYTEKQDDPKAKSCRKQAAFTAITAAVLLVACMAAGALTRWQSGM